MQLLKTLRLRLIPSLMDKLLSLPVKKKLIPEFREEILLPGQNTEYHKGFVNSATNSNGLKARFFRTTGDGIGVVWANTLSSFEGYPGIIHGGITASLLDEAMSYAVFQKTGAFGVTIKASIEWHKTLKVGDSVKGYAEVTLTGDNLVNVVAHLVRGDGATIVSGTGLFYIPTLGQFKRLAELKDVPTDVQKYFRSK